MVVKWDGYAPMGGKRRCLFWRRRVNRTTSSRSWRAMTSTASNAACAGSADHGNDSLTYCKSELDPIEMSRENSFRLPASIVTRLPDPDSRTFFRRDRFGFMLRGGAESINALRGACHGEWVPGDAQHQDRQGQERDVGRLKDRHRLLFDRAVLDFLQSLFQNHDL